MIAFCAERLARYKCPEKVMFVDELPLGTTGKVLRRVAALTRAATDVLDASRHATSALTIASASTLPRSDAGRRGGVGQQEAGEDHGDADDERDGEAVHLVEHRVEQAAGAEDQRPEGDQDVGARPSRLVRRGARGATGPRSTPRRR